MRTGNSLWVKEINRNLIRKQFLQLRKATKHELAGLTGLSQMTVGNVIADMLEDGELKQGELVPSNGGRPSAEYCYQGGFCNAAVLYAYQKANREYVRLIVIDLLGDIVYSSGQYFDDLCHDSFEELLDAAFKAVQKIRVITFGLPGEEQDGTVTINDFRNLVGKEFMQHYREKYNAKVLFINDVNGAVLGCYQRIAAKNRPENAVAGIYFPRIFHPGMGIVIDGCIYKGEQNFTGELGYLPWGQDFTKLDYNDRETLRHAITQLLTVIICIAAPSYIVLYGDFFVSGDEQAIRTETESILKGDYRVMLEVSESFEKDYEEGVISITLDELYTSMFGSGSEENKL